jgi:hypothetical protein
VRIFVRPERIGLSPRSAEGKGRSLPASVAAHTYLGRYLEVSLRLADQSCWTANIGDDKAFAGIEVGSQFAIEVEPSNVIAFASGDRNTTGM